MRIGRISLMLSVLALLWSPGQAATFTVDSTSNAADSSPGNGVCATAGAVCTLRAAIQEANANGVPDTIAFSIPLSDPGYNAGTGVFTISVTSLLPTLTEDGTTIDGTTQTANRGDTNAGLLGAGGTVGLGADAQAGTGDEPTLPQVAAPEIEINDGNNVRTGIDVQANSATIRGIAIYGFGQNLDADIDGDIRVGLDGTTDYTGILIEQNVIGSGAAGFTNPGVAAQTNGDGVILRGTDGGTFRNNLAGFTYRSAVKTHDDVTGWTFRENELRGNGATTRYGDGLDFGYITANATVERNLMVDNGASGVDSYESNGGNVITNNTVTGNGFAGQANQETSGIRLFGTDNEVTLNLIQNNFGDGVLVVGDGTALNQPSLRNEIGRNSFSGNGSNAIDLLADSGDPNFGDGITLNGGADNACSYLTSTGNDGLEYPVISTADYSGGTTTIVGQACPSSTVEIYRAAVGVGDTNAGTDYGEGERYLGFATTDGSGDFTFLTPGLAVGQAVTAIVIDGSANTSEFGPNLTVTSDFTISGTVFEDFNYGGDAGRDRATATGSDRPGARAEIYDNAGGYLGFTTTDGSGDYQFDVVAGNYVVRVVNNSVTSSRPGAVPGLWPVQTFRTDASSGTAVAVTDRVGGQVPGVQDDGDGAAGTTMNPVTGAFTAILTGQAQSIAPVTVGANVSGVDFGFSFDPIVNSNDSGQGSLRQLILNANALGNAGLSQAGRTAGIEHGVFMLADGTARPGLSGSYASQFSSGVATISPLAVQLDAVADPLVLDATLQPGYGGSPIVELNGSAAGSGAEGLTISAGGSTVRGLAIGNFNGNGIFVDTAGGNTIQACYLGTDASGLAAAQNFLSGIEVDRVSGNRIGGTDLADRNVISGNRLRGILLDDPGAIGNFIEGNYIGPNKNGDAAIPGQAIGIYHYEASGNTVGGSTPGAGNVISGNSIYGVYFVNPGSSGNQVQGNTISLNGNAGIVSSSGALNNTIGGTTTDEWNVISGNGAGIQLSIGSGNRIVGNSIYGNTGLGIDLGFDSLVNPNDGTTGGTSNNGMDYPVITGAALSGGSLRVEGFVGTPATKIAGVHEIQVYKADNVPADQDGEIILGDLLSVPHGEGRDYIGSCSGVADGTFACDLAVPGSVTLNIGNAVVATATDGGQNSSEFGANHDVEGLAIVKRAFQTDGTPIPSGTTLPSGMPVRFMVYINNPGGAVGDVSLQDALDPLFSYLPGSIRYANTQPSCALLACNPAEESTIFSSAESGSSATDAVGGSDPIGVVGGTIHAGNQTVANQSLGVQAGRVWVMTFTVIMQ